MVASHLQRINPTDHFARLRLRPAARWGADQRRFGGTRTLKSDRR